MGNGSHSGAFVGEIPGQEPAARRPRGRAGQTALSRRCRLQAGAQRRNALPPARSARRRQPVRAAVAQYRGLVAQATEAYLLTLLGVQGQGVDTVAVVFIFDSFEGLFLTYIWLPAPQLHSVSFVFGTSSVNLLFLKGHESG